MARRLTRWRKGRRAAIATVAVVLLAGGVLQTVGDSGESTDLTRMEMFAEAGPFEGESPSLFRRLFSRIASQEEPLVAEPDPDSLEAVSTMFRTVPFGDLITRSARKHQVDPVLVLAVIEAESSFREEAESSRGALGLMQLMPATGRWMGARNLLDPAQNIEAGTRYLKYLESRFSGDLTRQIAAYNAGEGTVRRYGGIPPYTETQEYVARVIENYERRSAELEQIRMASGI